MIRHLKRFLFDEDGAVYIVVLTMSVVCIFFIAIMIDAGRIYTEHTRLQHFIDRVAAAASLELDGGDDAITRAMAVVNSESLASKALYSSGESDNFEIDKIYFLTSTPKFDEEDSPKLEDIMTNNSFAATHILLTAKPRTMSWLFPDTFSGFDDTFKLTASAAAAAKLERDRDIEFTFAIDNSPSMLFAATQEEFDTLIDMLDCAFACHYDRGGDKTSYEIAKEAGIRFRLDSALNAVKLAAEYVKSNTIQGGATVYFDIDVFARKLEDVPYADGRADLLDFRLIGDLEPSAKPGNDIYTMTNPDKSFKDLSKVVEKKLKDSPDRDHIAVIMTDGVADYRNTGNNSRVIRTFSAEDCQDIKDQGIDIAVIYTKYLPAPENSFWVANIDPIDEEIPVNLQACASPGLFFEVTYADDIDAAFLALMQRQYEVRGARLTR